MYRNFEEQPMKNRPLEGDPRTTAILRNIVRRGTEQVVKKQFPFANSRIISESALVEGASGAMTIMVDSQMQLMFKIDQEDAAKEIKGFLIMEEVLPNHTLPLLAYDDSFGWLCVPYVSAANLHQAISKSLVSDRQLTAVYDDFLRQMSALWIRTFNDEASDNKSPIKRLQRKASVLASLRVPVAAESNEISFSTLFLKPMIVNGAEYPSIHELLNKALEMFMQNRVPFTVTTHGDEHAKNILLHKQADGNNPHWFLIDLPHVRTDGDWAWSIAQMRQWWQVSYYLVQSMVLEKEERAPVHLDIQDKQVMVDYDLSNHIPEICQRLDNKVAVLAHQFSALFTDTTWEKRYAASKFLVYFGLMFHYQQNEHIIPILLGELAASLASVR